MEEKKEKKEIRRNAVNAGTGNGTPKLYTEEQLNAACQSIYRDMYARLERANLNNMFKRLEYLFQVLEYKDCFDADFVGDCAEEIKDAMTIPAREDNDKKADDNAKEEE